MTLGDERKAVQDSMIQYAVEIGWEYISPDEALRLRGGKESLIFRELFIEQSQRLNPEYMNHLLG